MITEFFKVLSIKKLQTNTVNTYMSCIKSFLEWCEAEDIYPPEINKERLRDYFVTIESNSYLKQMRGTIGNLYEFVFGIPYILVGMPFPKQGNHLPDYFTPIELIQIFEAVKNPKQRTVLKLQYACALRVHEAVKVKWTDFIQTHEGYNLKVLGKGNKHDYIPVPDETIQALVQTFGNKFKDNEYVFKGQTKEHYATKTVQIVINRAMEICNITKDGSTHLLRHSRATHLIQSGVSLRHVQILLRHKSSKTTEVYTHLSTSDIRKACISADLLLAKENNIITHHSQPVLQ